MASNDKKSITKDYVIPLLAIIASGTAAFMSFKTSTAQQDLQSKIALLQADQAVKEFHLDVYIKSYGLVEKALSEKNAAAADFARKSIALIEDVEVQASLMKFLTNTVQEVADEKMENDASKKDFNLVIERAKADQKVLQSQLGLTKTFYAQDANSLDLKGWRIQVLYCSSRPSALKNATNVASEVASQTGAKSYLTLVGQVSERRFSNAPLNINYSSSDGIERDQAKQLASLLDSMNLINARFQLRPVATDYGNHMSIYVCV